MRTLPLLLVITAIAGCVDPAPPVEDPPMTTAMPPVAYEISCPPGANMTVREGVCAGFLASTSESLQEPYVALHPMRSDIVAIGVNAGQSTDVGSALVRLAVFVTEDAGRSWHRSSLPSFGLAAPTSAIDPALVFDAGGNLHATAMVRGATGGYAIAYAASPDLGRSWSGRIVDATGGNDRSWIAVAPDGRVVLTWGKPGADGVAAWSRDGAEWTTARVDTPDATCEETGPPVVHNGTVLVPCTGFDSSGTVAGVRIVRLDLDAGAITLLATTDVRGEWPLLFEVPARGLALLAETSDQVFLSLSANGTKWSSPSDIRDRFHLEDAWTVLEYQWAAADPWGRLHVMLKGDAVCHRDTPGLIDCPDADTVYGVWDSVTQGLIDEYLLDADVDPARPPPAAFRTNYEYDGLAWGPNQGFAAWTVDGRVAFSWIEPVTD